jgi:transposase
VGNWYWIVDEIEQAGCIPFLAHAAKAKVMMGNIHKTDKLDAQGLATLLYLGKLPSVWIPPAGLRDERELPRTRMTFAKHRAMVKNRIRSTLAKYALSLDTDSDIFTAKWRPELEATLRRLPPETECCLRQHLQLLDALNHHIRELEVRILQRIQASPSLQLVQSVPGPAKVLAIVIDRELGSIDRFPSPHHFASYCGLVPRLSASAGAKAIPSPSALWPATWPNQPTGFSRRVSPTGSPHTGLPQGANPLSRTAGSRRVPNMGPERSAS